MQPARLLVVDDHLEMARALADALQNAGYVVDAVGSGAEALERVQADRPALVISDLRMEGLDGFELIDRLRALDPILPILIMTAFGSIDTAIEAIRRGAYHYVAKPFQLGEVLLHVERALGERRLREENRSLRTLLGETTYSGMVGRSEAMQVLFETIERVAQSSAPVLIRGESGTGKELIARALHARGPRASGPFIAVNCAALPETLLESELFGHARGAFTGATSARRGLLLAASGGTLFLDEIADMPLSIQAKMLRVLEDREVRALGVDAGTAIDVRFIAATHRDIEQRVREQTFREDLFYRLNVVPTFAPPLRARAADVPLLAQHFLAKALYQNPGSKVRRLSAEVLVALQEASWPGNVRELENLIERLVILTASEEVGLQELGQHGAGVGGARSAFEPTRGEVRPLRDVETEYIAWAVEQCGGNKNRAAELLGIDVSTIYRRSKALRT